MASDKSLSPLPDKHNTSNPSPAPGFLSSQAIACAGSSAGTIPSSRASSANARSASLSVTDS